MENQINLGYVVIRQVNQWIIIPTFNEEKNIAERGLNIGKTYDIIIELNSTLDHKIGGKIASDLEQLYMFITDQFTKANINNDPKPLQEALKILETLYEGWKQAVEQIKKSEEKTILKAK